MARLLVFGRRNYTNQDKAFEVLDRAVKNLELELVIAGEARGADTFGKLWAKDRGFKYKGYPADWSKGKVGGILRNQQMLTEGKPTHAIAFWLSQSDFDKFDGGTADMARRLQAANIPIWHIKG